MMLRDAYCVLYYMKMTIQNDDEESIIIRRLGMSEVAFMYKDFFMLENQIPLWLVNLLIAEISEDKSLLYKFLSSMMPCGNSCSWTQVPWGDKELDQPLHLLEAHRVTLVKEEKTNTDEPAIKKPSRRALRISPFRSVTDLKAKGIHFRPSSYYLNDINFSSYSSYGKLQLPILFINNNTNVFFSNVIALEMSPESSTDFAVISYVNFMKSLIQNPEDVKELREKGVLLSCLANDEEVVKMFTVQYRHAIKISFEMSRRESTSTVLARPR